MKCERCNINQATHHYQKSINGVVSDKYLCSACAAEENMPFKIFTGGGASVFPPFIGVPFLGSPFDTESTAAQPVPKCGACGTTLNEFNETAYLGCEQCYTELRQYLEPVIKKLHGSTQHTGKAPRREGANSVSNNKVADRSRLVRQLEKAIQEEEFEEAARLRDMIRVIDSEGGGK